MFVRSVRRNVRRVAQVRFNHVQAHDIVIIGGGPAGLTLATALKNSPVTRQLKVALVEGAPLDRVRSWQLPDDRYENRVSSLTPKSVRFLTKIGAWDHIQRERVKDYDEMKVWDGCSDARIDFDPSILGENMEIAYMVENVNLQQSLMRRIDELNTQLAGQVPETKIYDQARVKSITHGHTEEGAWPVVELENGDKMAARLLVGADGANSPVRAFAGIASRGWDYNRHGLVATVKLEWEDFRSVAWQRFLVTGPIALLPMPNGYGTLVWSTTPERAQHLKSLSPEDFCALVNAGFRLGPVDLTYLHTLSSGIVDEVEWRLENTPIEDEDNSVPIRIVDVQEKTRMNFPLKMKHADTYVADRVALVGDAAHSTHPLAGQGLNMGQSDVSNLVSALETAMKRGLDIGSLLAIEPFWKESYFPNHAKLGVVDKLHKLYSTDFEPLVQLRSFGLNAVNNWDWLKGILMHNASNK
ncbi:ubiquinone biosynthesis monooxygenase Coq6p, mitochondrial [Trichomonascus vanleenenianus]|uniref:putative N,N-dimethylaniline monooxygenase COQ6 n=1 Tax=Trichomonascus vanleenenianus TaxID=2268995 RepID=UPI003ECA0BA2